MKRVSTWMLAICMLLCMVLNGCRREGQSDLPGTETGTQAQVQTGETTHLQTTPGSTAATQTETAEATADTKATETTAHTDPEDTKPEQTEQEEPATQATQGSSENWESTTATAGTVPMEGAVQQTQGTELTIGETGKTRLEYSVNLSSVKYVTSVDQLPDCQGLEAFDDAYFKDHALLIVIETVSSGSVNTGIESVAVHDGNADVTLFHETRTGIVTADMTTWLLWAEVDKDLDFNWSVSNPAVESDSSIY